MKTHILVLIILEICSYSFSTLYSQVHSPDQFLGYELGSKFTRHHLVVDYFQHLADNSKRIKLEKIGKTYEGRQLMVAFLGSEKVISRLEDFRLRHLNQIGRTNLSLDGIEVPIVWLSYNVHGNESSSTEAAMKTAYSLLNERKDLLEKALVVIDPCLNPDGRDRYVNHFCKVQNLHSNDDRNAREHYESWPSGRLNHYHFDMNRDWLWCSQVESVSRINIFKKWLPHVHVDFHEQGCDDEYYFPPAAQPYHTLVSPWQSEFQNYIGESHSKYFDRNGWLYFTKEEFDLLYPSYGDTYPTYHGSIGMTYEMNGIGAGLNIRTNKAENLTLKDRLNHHFVTGISTIETSIAHGDRLITELINYYKSPNKNVKNYVLQGNSASVNQLKKLLELHKIKYNITSAQKLRGLRYKTQKVETVDIQLGSLVISNNQMYGKLVDVIFEPKTFLGDSVTYDITAWSIPYVYNLDAIVSEGSVSIINEAQKDRINTSVNNLGYLCEWNHSIHAKFLGFLWQKDIKVRLAKKELIKNGKTLHPGTLVILKRDNKNINLDEIIREYLINNPIELQSIDSYRMNSVPDLGSNSIEMLRPKSVAILAGDPTTSSSNYGEIWHYFEQELNYPITQLDAQNVSRIHQYDIVFIPEFDNVEFVSNNFVSDVKKFTDNGGTVIAIGSSIMALKSLDSTNLEAIDIPRDSNDVDILDSELYRNELSYTQNGAIYPVKVDYTQKLGYGYYNQYYTSRLGTFGIKRLKEGKNTAIITPGTKSLAGFVGSKIGLTQQNTLVAGYNELQGGGLLVYFPDNPLFRSYWDGGKLLIANAAFFLGVEGHQR